PPIRTRNEKARDDPGLVRIGVRGPNLAQHAAHHAADKGAGVWAATAAATTLTTTAPATTTALAARTVLVIAGTCRRRGGDDLRQQGLVLQLVEEAGLGVAAGGLPAGDHGAGRLVELAGDLGVETKSGQATL